MENKKYSFWKGLWKSVENNLVIWAPAALAFLASVPIQYTPIASVVAYLIKNAIQFKVRK